MAHEDHCPAADDAAVLRAMAEHGIRISDRAFERHTLAVLAELERLQDGTRIDGDLVTAAILRAAKEKSMRNDQAARVKRLVLEALAAMPGVTVLRGPDQRPWTPNSEED